MWVEVATFLGAGRALNFGIFASISSSNSAVLLTLSKTPSWASHVSGLAVMFPMIWTFYVWCETGSNTREKERRRRSWCTRKPYLSGPVWCFEVGCLRSGQLHFPLLVIILDCKGGIAGVRFWCDWRTELKTDYLPVDIDCKDHLQRQCASFEEAKAAEMYTHNITVACWVHVEALWCLRLKFSNLLGHRNKWWCSTSTLRRNLESEWGTHSCDLNAFIIN